MRPDDVVLLREEVFPVCSPDLYPLASTEVHRCRLLQEVNENSPELDWRSWASEFGLPDNFEKRVIRYASFSQVIGAAVGGAGLALGRSPLIDPELASGRLVRLLPDLARLASWRFVLRRGPRAPALDVGPVNRGLARRGGLFVGWSVDLTCVPHGRSRRVARRCHFEH